MDNSPSHPRAEKRKHASDDLPRDEPEAPAAQRPRASAHSSMRNTAYPQQTFALQPRATPAKKQPHSMENTLQGQRMYQTSGTARPAGTFQKSQPGVIVSPPSGRAHAIPASHLTPRNFPAQYVASVAGLKDSASQEKDFRSRTDQRFGGRIPQPNETIISGAEHPQSNFALLNTSRGCVSSLHLTQTLSHNATNNAASNVANNAAHLGDIQDSANSHPDPDPHSASCNGHKSPKGYISEYQRFVLEGEFDQNNVGNPVEQQLCRVNGSGYAYAVPDDDTSQHQLFGVNGSGYYCSDVDAGSNDHEAFEYKFLREGPQGPTAQKGIVNGEPHPTVANPNGNSYTANTSTVSATPSDSIQQGASSSASSSALDSAATTTTRASKARCPAGSRRPQRKRKEAKKLRPKPKLINDGILEEYLHHDEPLPEGTTLEGMCEKYPNHLKGTGLDPFFQWRWSHNDIWKRVPDHIKDRWIELGVIDAQTKVRSGFLCNRMRSRIDDLGGYAEVARLLEQPKMYHSVVGMRNGLKNLEKYLAETDAAAQNPPSKRAKTEVDEDESTAQELPNKRARTEANEEPGATASAHNIAERRHEESNTTKQSASQPSSVGAPQVEKVDFLTAFQKEVNVMPGNDHPHGLFWGLPFWQKEDDFSYFVKEVSNMMKGCNDMANEVVAADLDLMGASASVKMDRKLYLLRWGNRSRRDYIDALESADTTNKVNLNTHLRAAVAAMAKRAAHKYLLGLKKEFRKSLANGVADEDLVELTREAVLRDVGIQMRDMRKDLRQKWVSLKQSEPQVDADDDARNSNVFGNEIRGQKRDRDDSEHASRKKARLEGTTSSQATIVQQPSQSDVKIETAQEHNSEELQPEHPHVAEVTYPATHPTEMTPDNLDEGDLRAQDPNLSTASIPGLDIGNFSYTEFLSGDTNGIVDEQFMQQEPNSSTFPEAENALTTPDPDDFGFDPVDSDDSLEDIFAKYEKQKRDILDSASEFVHSNAFLGAVGRPL